MRKGAVFSLNWELEKPDPPVLGRHALRHHVIDLDGGTGTDDYYDSFYPQVSTQWDSLLHMASPGNGFCNGCRLSDFTGRPGAKNGIDNWARRGIVGRFVLADVQRWRQAEGRPIDNAERDVISVDEIDATLASQGTPVEDGDVLLVRLGWVGWYVRIDQDARDPLGAMPVPGMKTPGLSPDPKPTNGSGTATSPPSPRTFRRSRPWASSRESPRQLPPRFQMWGP